MEVLKWDTIDISTSPAGIIEVEVDLEGIIQGKDAILLLVYMAHTIVQKYGYCAVFGIIILITFLLEEYLLNFTTQLVLSW